MDNQKKLISFPPDILQAIENYRDKKEEESGERPSFSASVRVLLRVSLKGLGWLK